jgi:cytochrome c oxidase subunit 2
MYNLFYLIQNSIRCDAPEPWQLGFQDGATPTYEGITELHNSIFFYLVVIFIGVT